MLLSGFHPLYRGTWYLTVAHIVKDLGVEQRFPSAISRYLVSDCVSRDSATCGRSRFHPLYRGTWYLTLPEKHPL